MADESTGTVATEEAPSIDIAAASEQIGADLFSDMQTEESSPQETVAKAVVESGAAQDQAKQAAVPTVRQAPKSWAKDMHPVWKKLDPLAQDYTEKREKDFLNGIEQYKGAAQAGAEIQKVLAPYQPLLQSKGLDAPKAIDDMLGAYSRLTQGTMEQRQAALLQVAKNLGVAMPAPSANGTETTTPLDPRIQTIEQQLQEMRDVQTRQQQVALEARQQQVSAEIQAFVSAVDKDGKPTHPFFDECYDDLVKLLKVGESLQDAYDKAVWANPVTREKSKLAYFQTESEKAKERARLDALPKQKARGVNVRSQDTQRGPTDPLGSMEDTMRATLKTIKERTIH